MPHFNRPLTLDVMPSMTIPLSYLAMLTHDHTQQLYAWHRKGLIHCTKEAGKLMITPEEVSRMITEGMVKMKQ